jgi:hypothetical protein
MSKSSSAREYAQYNEPNSDFRIAVRNTRVALVSMSEREKEQTFFSQSNMSLLLR